MGCLPLVCRRGQGLCSEVAAALKKANTRVFYDEYEQVDLWGKNLYDHLDEVYRRQARYCVIFVSENYARKAWPNRERQSAQARALERNREYILPARFDDTEIKGLQSTIGYVDLRKVSPQQFAALIIEKLNQPEIKQRVAYRFIGDGPTQHMRVVPQREFELVMELDQELDHNKANAISEAFPTPPFQECEINTALPTVVIKGLVDAWAVAEALQIVSDAAWAVWTAVGPKDSMIVTIEGKKRYLKLGRGPENLRVDFGPGLNLQRCTSPNWRDGASLSLVDNALQRLGSITLLICGFPVDLIPWLPPTSTRRIMLSANIARTMEIARSSSPSHLIIKMAKY